MTITIENYRTLFTNVRTRPGMWFARSDLSTVVAFVTGCDQANARGLLTGFQEWLVTRAGYGESFIWWAIVVHLTEPVGAKDIGDMDAGLEARVVETLWDLLDEFLELRAEDDGLNRIYAAHHRWTRLRAEAGCGSRNLPETPWPRPRSRTDPPPHGYAQSTPADRPIP